MPELLSRPHRERIAQAVEATLAGHEVTFAIHRGEFADKYTWLDRAFQRQVILSGEGRAFQMQVEAARMEFNEQLTAALAAAKEEGHERLPLARR